MRARTRTRPGAAGHARGTLARALPALLLGAGLLMLQILQAMPAAAGYDRSRVVSIGGSLTEILYALELEKHIAAVDTTSVYPAAALAEHPDVGYMRALSAEGVLSVNPTLILMVNDAGPQETLTMLERASVPLVRIPDESTPKGLAAKIRTLGEAMGAKERADTLAKTVTADLERVRTAAADVEERPSVLFILSMSGGRILAAGDGTSADSMIELAGGRNAFEAVEGYKPASTESVVEAAPEVIVTINRGDHAATVEDIVQHPVLGSTPAAENRRVVIMDGLYLLGFGPRTAHALRDLFLAFYPDRDLPPLESRPWTKTE